MQNALSLMPNILIAPWFPMNRLYNRVIQWKASGMEPDNDFPRARLFGSSTDTMKLDIELHEPTASGICPDLSVPFTRPDLLFLAFR